MTKVCPACGREFEATFKVKYCSEECRSNALLAQKRAYWKERRAREKEPFISPRAQAEARREMMKRLAARDEEYARNCQVPVTKCVKDGVVIEWRGRPMIGSHSLRGRVNNT